MFDLRKINVMYDEESDEYRDEDTGYLLSKTKVSKRINEYIQDETIESMEGIIQVDGLVDFRIIKSRSGQNHQVINVKRNFDFVKTFKVDLRDMLEEIDLSPHACKFMYKLTPWIHYPENTIVYKKQNPSIEKLGEILNVKRAKMFNILKELEGYDFIKRVKINGQLVIYVNPYIHSCGWVSSETCELFKDSVHNHDKLYH